MKPGECGLRGWRWNKDSDTIAVTFPQEIVAATKRGVLGKIAKVYDPLGLVSPLTLEGKMLYRYACQQKKAWDAELPQELVKRWQKWEMKLPVKTEVLRALVPAREPIQAVALQAYYYYKPSKMPALKGSRSCLCSGRINVRGEPRIGGGQSTPR